MTTNTRREVHLLAGIALAVFIVHVRCAAHTFQANQTLSINWRNALEQKSEWYGSPDAVRIADNVLLYQRNTGGWPKNLDMAAVLTDSQRTSLQKEKTEVDSTIDNGATYTQLVFLARVYSGTKLERYRGAFIKGFDYLLAAQYENGGWPQYYPIRQGYYQHITFNDDAMVGVMRLLRDVAQRKPQYLFVNQTRRQLARKAVDKGIECILKTQVSVRGRLTVWCAQHDEVTLAPAPARTYEHISLSGLESVGIVEFLLDIQHPDARVVDAIESAIAWFRSARINGIRVVQTSGPPPDRIVVSDGSAPPLWARFYDIETNRPIFSGRDSVIKYSMAEIERERRNGYRWYTDAPAKLLASDYPAWQRRARAPKH